MTETGLSVRFQSFLQKIKHTYMDTIPILKSNAHSAWKSADQSGKNLLEKLLGKENIPVSVTMDMVNSFEDACRFDGKDPLTILPYPNPKNRDEIHLNGTMKLIIIFRVLNGPDWKPDYRNKSQPKWWIYMIWDDTLSAFRFVDADVEYEGANAGTGVRQTSRTKEIAEYIGRKFEKVINEVIGH